MAVKERSRGVSGSRRINDYTPSADASTSAASADDYVATSMYVSRDIQLESIDIQR